VLTCSRRCRGWCGRSTWRGRRARRTCTCATSTGRAPMSWSPRHLTQVRSLPVSATSRNCCAGVPTWTRAKNCPVPLYAVRPGRQRDVDRRCRRHRLPLPRDASTEAMYAYRCRSSLARSNTDAPGTRSNRADVPWCSFPPSLATADAASAINTSSASRCPCNTISLSPFASSASAVAMPAYLYRHTTSN
jgi:hypothetical protein